MKGPLRRLILFCFGLVLLGAVTVLRRIEKVRAYSDTTTHKQLAERTVDLAATEPSYEELKQFVEIIRDADKSEDAGSRGDNHFFDPSNNGGLATSSTIRVIYNPVMGWLKNPTKAPGGQKAADGLPHYISALDWATDQMGLGPGLDGTQKELDWKGAIQAYDYTPEAKRDAYEAAGHVLHLVQDMGQPDHVMLRPHPCNYLRDYLSAVLPDKAGYEALWAREYKSWPAGRIPVNFKTLEEAFIKLAKESQNAERQLGLPMADEIALGCGPPRGAVIWPLGVVVGGLSTAAAGQYDIIQSPLTGHLSEQFANNSWNTYEFENVPAVPMIPWEREDPRTQKYLELGKTLLPRVEEYGAGLLRLFHDIVNQPPFVEEVEIYQNGQQKYRKTWKDDETGDPRHVQNRHIEVEEDSELEPGVDAEVTIRIGPKDPFPKLNDAFIRRELKSLLVTIVPDDSKPEEATPLAVARATEPKSPRGGIWKGHFAPSRSATLRIEAVDLNEHYKDAGGQREQSLTPVNGQRRAQGQLDANPATPARATWPEPYVWKGYDSGPDTNHHFKVKGGACPILSQMQWGKWLVRYTRSYSRHLDRETCDLGPIACDSPAAHDPATHSNYWHPCSESYSEKSEADGYVFSAWPYPQGGNNVTVSDGMNYFDLGRVHFPWSQLQPNDFRHLLFGRLLMADKTTKIKEDSTCKRPPVHGEREIRERFIGQLGKRTKCDIKSLNVCIKDGRDVPWGSSQCDEEYDFYEFIPVAPPSHFSVVTPITFGLDDLTAASEAVVRNTLPSSSSVCNNAPRERMKECYEAFNRTYQLERVLVQSAEEPWGELTKFFWEADSLWWTPPGWTPPCPPICGATAPDATKVEQLKGAASRWQALSSTIPHHLAISIDAIAQTIGPWNPQIAGDLRRKAQMLRDKGLDLPGSH